MKNTKSNNQVVPCRIVTCAVITKLQANCRTTFVKNYNSPIVNYTKRDIVDLGPDTTSQHTHILTFAAEQLFWRLPFPDVESSVPQAKANFLEFLEVCKFKNNSIFYIICLNDKNKN